MSEVIGYAFAALAIAFATFVLRRIELHGRAVDEYKAVRAMLHLAASCASGDFDPDCRLRDSLRSLDAKRRAIAGAPLWHWTPAAARESLARGAK